MKKLVMKKQVMNKKVKILIVIIVVILIIFAGILSTGGKRADIMLNAYSISEDGSVMTVKVGVASSMGYVRTMKVKQKNDNKYITFYSTYGLNSNFLANDEFEIELTPDCEEIYFYNGDGEYKLVLLKNKETNEWERVRYVP